MQAIKNQPLRATKCKRNKEQICGKSEVEEKILHNKGPDGNLAVIGSPESQPQHEEKYETQ